MAIVTDKMRRLQAETFLTALAGTATQNLYFFFGRSKPWVDPDSNIGIGTLSLLDSSITLTINQGNFNGIPTSSTIKNLDTGEVRQVASFNTLYTEAKVNAPPSTPWSTTNWAWKDANKGKIWKDDTNPPMPNGSQYNQYENDMTMLALKKINQSTLNDSISYVVKRFDWDSTGETMYTMYRDNDGALLEHPNQEDVDEQDRWNSQNPSDTYISGSSYVLVHVGSNYYIFKCLDNGSRLGLDPTDPSFQRKILLPNKSIVLPDKTQCTSANDYIHTASDGYKWKFLYSLSADQVLKFLTDNWIPVKVAINPTIDPSSQNVEQWQIQQNAKPGAIDIIRLTRCDNAVPYYGDTILGTALTDDQSVLPSNQIQLPADASIEDNYYKGCEVYSFTTGEKKIITSYIGTNRIANLSSSWNTVPVMGDLVCVAPKVTISGAFEGTGTPAPAVARAVVQNGYITDITVISKGLSYRLAKIRITVNDPEEEVAFGEAEVSPIDKAGLAVIGGHGYNAIKELGGFDVMFFTELRNIEGYINTDRSYDFMQSNEYRVVGLVKDVQDPLGGYPSDATLKAVKTLVLTTTSGNPDFVADEVIEYRNGSNVLLAKAYVIEYLRDSLHPTIGTATFFQDLESGFDTFTVAVGAILTGLTSGATATITQVEDAETNKYSGDILYIEQRKPVIRAPSQLETMKLVIEF